MPRPRQIAHLTAMAVLLLGARPALAGPPPGPEPGPTTAGPILLEVSPGAGADRRAQYVVLDVTGLPLGPSLDGFSLRSEDLEGNPLGLVADLSATDLDGRGVLLVATGTATRLYDVLPDVTASLAAIPEGSGRLCLFDLDVPVDCVAFGAFLGDDLGFGAPTASVIRGQALVRVATTGLNVSDWVVELADPAPFGRDPAAVPPLDPDPADPLPPVARPTGRDATIDFEPFPDLPFYDPDLYTPGVAGACASAQGSAAGAAGLMGLFAIAFSLLRRRR